MKITISMSLNQRLKATSRNTRLLLLYIFIAVLFPVFLLFTFVTVSLALSPRTGSARPDHVGMMLPPFPSPTATDTSTPGPSPTLTNTPVPTSTPVPASPPAGDSFAQTQIRENQVQFTTQFDSSAIVVPGGGSASAAKTYDIIVQLQNISPVNAPAVLANVVVPSGMNVSSTKWDKTGNWYSDSALSRTCNYDGRTAYCGIGQLWSGMEATITLRVSAEPGQYSLGINAEDLSALYEVPSNNRSVILVTLN